MIEKPCRVCKSAVAVMDTGTCGACWAAREYEDLETQIEEMHDHTRYTCRTTLSEFALDDLEMDI